MRRLRNPVRRRAKRSCTLNGWMLTLMTAAAIARTASAPSPNRQARSSEGLRPGMTVNTPAPHTPVQLLLQMALLRTTPTEATPHTHTRDQGRPRRAAPQSTPLPPGTTKNVRRQGSVGKNSSDVRYVPADEKKEKVKTTPKREANGPRDTSRIGQQRVHPPVARPAPLPPPRTHKRPLPKRERSAFLWNRRPTRVQPTRAFPKHTLT